MSSSFVFVGDPGPDTPRILEMLSAKGLSAKRFFGDFDIAEIEKVSPVAVAVSASYENRAGLFAAIRERGSLASLPVLVRHSRFVEQEIDRAFVEGADDYFIDGKLNQFGAVVAAVTKADTWSEVRAPLGTAILAHPDRMQRVRYGHSLRRSGLDPYFVSDQEGLVEALAKVPVRAVVVLGDLMADRGGELLGKAKGPDGEPGWIIVSSSGNEDSFGDLVAQRSKARLLDCAADPEAIRFLLNDLLAPAPPEGRRTQRIIYCTPVSFRPESSEEEPFWGHSYNVNSGGMFIRTLAPLPLQARMEIAFRPPFGKGKVVVTAQVVWRKTARDDGPSNSPPGMGIQIVDAMPADARGYEAGYAHLLEATAGKSSLAPPTAT